MSRATPSLLAGLGLIALVETGCPSRPVAPPVEEPKAADPITPGARWDDPLAEVTVAAPSEDWQLTPSEPAGGTSGVRIITVAQCSGHVWRSRVATIPDADRSKALETRILARLASQGVRDVVVRDRGDVPHGQFRARMLRVDGSADGQPWSGRLTATFVTRSTGRFYIEIAAISRASTFVARRNCFDAVTAACTIHGDQR